MHNAWRCGLALAVGLQIVVDLCAPASAQSVQPWPQRTVRLLLPLGPGSGVDVVARLLVDPLSQRWGQPVVIENRPGGDGIVALGAFANAKDDHILLFSPSSSFTAHPYLHDNVPYKPSDLAPIARVSNTIIAISVPGALPVNTLDELMKLARAQPGKLNWAGVTGALDFMFASYLKSANLDISKVPYRNAVDAANDLAENRIQVYRSAYAIIRAHAQSGKAKILALSNSKRAPALPNIPTVSDAGYPELTIDGLIGLFGPPSMPQVLRERLAADIKAVIDSNPTFGERIALSGQFVNPGGPDEFGQSIDHQRAILAAAAQNLGIPSKQ